LTFRVERLLRQPLRAAALRDALVERFLPPRFVARFFGFGPKVAS